MPHVLQSVKSDGGNITRAELVTFLDNLEWFRTPPAYRLYNNGGPFQTLSGSMATMDYAGTPHYEWLEEGGGNPDGVTYHSGTGGEWVNVGDVASGLWINGVMFAVRNVVSIIGGQNPRAVRIEMRRGTGAAWTEIADFTSEDRNSGRRGAVHMAGIGSFDGTTDRVELRAQASASTPPVVQDRRWGIRLGSATPISSKFTASRQVSDTNDEMVGAFNRLRANQLRIERRPSAQRYKTGGNQALTGGVEALVSLGASDWSTDSNMAVGGVPNGVIVRERGVYLTTAQLTLADYDSAASFAGLTIKTNTADVVATNSQEASAYDTTVLACDLVQLAEDDTLSMHALTGTATSVQSSRGTYLTATLMSSNQGVSPGRQVWDRMPAPATWPNVGGMSSDRCPAGTLRVLSDLTDRQWNRPAWKARLVDDVEIKFGSGWTNVDCDELQFDYTALEATHGYTLVSGGALVLPWAGTWLVGARVFFSPQSADGVNIGSRGIRGMRLALGERQSAGAFISAAMNGSGHGWARTICETVVVNHDEGQEVRVQALADASIGPTSSLVAAAGTTITTLTAAAVAITDLADQIDESDYEAVVTSAHLWAVELGEGITRVPR